MEFTGLKDADREILSKLEEDTDLLNACSVNKYAWKLCDDIFFRNRLIRKYPDAVKYNKSGKWKEYYLRTIFYISKLLEKYNFVYKTGNPKIYYDILFKTQHVHIQLEEAAENNYLDLVNFLLSMQPAFMRYLYIQYIIGGATLNNNIDMIQHFLKEADVNALDQGLIRAVQKNNYNLVNLFVEKGANAFEVAIKIAEIANDRKMIDYLKKFL